MNNTQTEEVVKTGRKNKIVAINAKGNLAEALRIHLGAQPKHKRTEFVIIDKLSDRPEGSSIASLNMPSFIPGTEGVTVTTVGSRYDKDSTAAQKSAQWALLRNEDASVESLIAELGNPQDYLVIPERAMSDVRLELADLTLDIATGNEEQKAAAFKRSFEILQSLVS